MASTGDPSKPTARPVCVGVVVRALGLTGEVCIKSFTVDPAHVARYGPLWDETGHRTFRLSVTGGRKGLIAARVEGIEDRAAAEALRGQKLFVARAALPEPEEDEFYHADLVGLRAELAGAEKTAKPLGRVCAVHDFGAGDVIEIEGGPAGALMIPFTRAAVPVVDIPGRRVVIAPLPGLLADSDRERHTGDEDAP